MQSFEVDGLTFKFEKDWKVSKYDEWAFYRNRFCSITPGRKAVDLLAISPESVLHLIEVKDYRQNRRVKSLSIIDEITIKAVDTLAALLPTSLCNDFPKEQEFAKEALNCTKISIVLHLEQGRTGSRISPRRFKLENIELQMQKALKSLDRRCQASDTSTMQRLQWTCA